MALEVKDVNISKVLEEKELTVLDFWAEWCGPCKMLGPVIDSLSLDEENKDITIGKVNVDHNNISANKYEVRSIPTILFLKNGEVVDKMVGYKSKQELQNKINSLK